MATFNYLMRKQEAMKARLVEYSGLDFHVVDSVVQYAKQLLKPGTTDITSNVFTSQMIHQFNITNQTMISQMYEALTRGRKSQALKETPGAIRTCTLEEYCWLISTFLTKSLDLKVNWVFSVYDTNNDGQLCKIELYTLLKPCVLHSDDMELEDAVRELVDIVVGVFDIDKNGFIDLEEFRMLVKHNVLYIDLLGQCLPAEDCLNAFITKLENKSPIQVIETFRGERRRNSIMPVLNTEEKYYPIDLDMP